MKTIDPNSIKKILFITLSNIGDAILTTPCLDLLSRFFKKAEITVMAGPRVREIFQDHPQVARLILYDKHAGFMNKLTLIIHLKEEKFDLVVDLRNTMIPLLIQPRYSTALIRKKFDGHSAFKHLQQLKRIGIQGLSNFSLPNLEPHARIVEEMMSVKGLTRDSGHIVLGPSAANPLKRWGLVQYKTLAELLKVKHQKTIIIVGPNQDRKEFSEAFPHEDWINFTGDLTLMQLGALLKKAELFITNDSGPMHLASALKTPVLAIFGPTDHKIYGPMGARDRVVRLELECSPCMAHECRLKTHACMEELDVERVYQIASQMLFLGS